MDGRDRFSDLMVAVGEVSEGLVTDIAAECKEGERLEARSEDIPGEMAC